MKRGKNIKAIIRSIWLEGPDSSSVVYSKHVCQRYSDCSKFKAEFNCI